MHKIVKAEPLPDYRLRIEFDDGVAGVVELGERLFGPVFEPLRDPDAFREVQVDEYGVVCWPNGADLAPDALYAQLSARQGSDASPLD